jgi:hypothetical protein
MDEMKDESSFDSRLAQTNFLYSIAFKQAVDPTHVQNDLSPLLLKCGVIPPHLHGMMLTRRNNPAFILHKYKYVKVCNQTGWCKK